MPVQINEMVIRAHIDETPDAKRSPQAGAAPQEMPDKEALIKECADYVMELINRKNER